MHITCYIPLMLKQKRRRTTSAERDQICDLYLNHGYPISRIISELGLGFCAVHYTLKSRGIPRRPSGYVNLSSLATDRSATKRCNKCKAYKPVKDFAESNGRILAYCNTCLDIKTNEAGIPIGWRCVTCGEWKIKENFFARRTSAIGRDFMCGECREPEAKKFAHHLRRRYKTTPEWYDAKLSEQGGRCAICGAPTTRSTTHKRFAIDHCHRTGKLRGLLCCPCNSGIGQLGDSIDRLQQAIRYLEKNGSEKVH